MRLDNCGRGGRRVKCRVKGIPLLGGLYIDTNLKGAKSSLGKLQNMIFPQNKVHISSVKNSIKYLKIKNYQSSDHQKSLPYQILDGKTVVNVQIDPQTIDIWTTNLNVSWGVNL